MKIGFIEPVYRDSLIAFNKYVRGVLKKRRKNFPVWNNPELGLLTVAAMVPDDWEVTYFDSYYKEIEYSVPYDIIAIGGITRQAQDMYDISEKFKHKGAYVVLGGIHTTIMPEEAKNHADTVIIGEAEDIFPQFIDDYLNNKAKPFYKAIKTVDITKSPIPRFDILKKEYQNYPIQTTRGCPHDCNFCSTTRIYGEKYRHKTVEQIIEEIIFLKSLKHNPFVIFVDNNMFVNKAFAYELVEKLIPLQIKWQAQSDVSIGNDKELLKLLYNAGCKELFIGFESVNPENIRDINTSQWKSKKVHEYRSLVNNIQNSGIRIFGAFILGFDKDTQEDFDNIKKFVIDNKILGQFTILTPLPGTQLYDEYKISSRLLKRKSWKYYNFVDCVIKHPHLSSHQLEKATAELYDVTYSDEHYARVLGHLIKVYKELGNY